MRDDAAELALAFAEAIARPGGQALLIDAENRSAEESRWVTIDVAASSGRAFAIEPCDHMVAIDVDDEADRLWAADVRAGLEPRGCRFVVVESGREDHQHLWVLVPPGWTYEYLKTQMESVAGAPRAWGQVRKNATRPPFAPHRLGGRSRVSEPGLQTALKLFRSHRSQGIPDLARQALVWFAPQAVTRRRGQVDRGITIHRAAVSLVNARCPQSDLVELLRGNHNEVTSKYHEQPADRRQDYVDLVWRRATEWVRENPPKSVDRDAVEGLLEDVPTMRWSSRTGSNDRAVYLALLELGSQAGSLVVDASVRRLSDLTSLSPTGVQAALGRLADQGFIARVVEPGRAHHLASSYRLLLDVPRETDGCAHTWSFLRGPKAMCAGEPEILEDIFSNGSGLGLATRETWEALPEQPTKTAEVVALLPGKRSHASVLAQLNKLNKHGFVGRRGHRWWRLQPPLDDLARIALTLGVKGKNQRRRARHEREQKDYRDLFNHRLPTDPAA